MQKPTIPCYTTRKNSRQVKKIFFALLRSLLVAAALFADNLSFAGSNILKIDSVQVFPTQVVTLNISINNQDPSISFQVDIKLPSNFTYISGSAVLNPARKVDHVFSISLLTGNTIRVLCYSPSNQPFLGSSGNILSFKLNTPAEPGSHALYTANALIVSPDATNILTGIVDGAVNVMGPLIVSASASPQQLCAGAGVQLNSTISGGGWNPLLIWISTPAGFSSMHPSPVAYPQQTTQYGIIINDGYQIASDVVIVTVSQPPAASAGNDLYVHLGNSIQIHGAMAQNHNSVIWTTTGDGQFSNISTLNPSYMPGFMDISFGSVTLILTATAITPCNNATDQLTLRILKQGDNIVSLEAGTAYLKDTVTINVNVKNKHDFTSFACKIDLPPQFTYITGSAALTGRKADHLLASSATGNALFFHAESPTNSLFSGNQGAVLRFKLLTGATTGQFQITIAEASVLEPFGANIVTDLVNVNVIVLISGLIRPAPTSHHLIALVRHPESDALMLELNLAKAAKVQTEIYDLTGRCLFRSAAVHYAVGQHFAGVDHLTSRIANKSRKILLLRVLVVDEPAMNRTFKLSSQAY